MVMPSSDFSQFKIFSKNTKTIMHPNMTPQMIIV